MSDFTFLTIKEDKTLAFLDAFHIARHHHVVARVFLNQTPMGLTYSGCLLVQQSIEMFVKAILHLHRKSKGTHSLLELLERGKGEVAYFDKLLKEPKLSYFIRSLWHVYTKMRFGEAGFNVQINESIQILNEVAFNLHKSYIETMKFKDQLPLYVPDAMKEAFLRDNKYFGEKDISTNFTKLMGLT
jgi:HEPN domain-containing protein